MKHIRTSKFTKIIASYLAIQLIISTVQPSNLYALTSGPSQPEFNAFTPIGTSDMVNLSSGDFNYNIPIMDVGGYPLNLAYDSGITMDQEASWVGLGWNLNVGQINRQVRGLPDDFKGDPIYQEKNIKNHITVGINTKLDVQLMGLEQHDNVSLNAGIGMGVNYSNYYGVSFEPTYGLSFSLANLVNVGVDVSTSTTEGVSVNPRLGISGNLKKIDEHAIGGGLNAGLSFNSSRGLSAFNLQASTSASFKDNSVDDKGNKSEVKQGHGLTSGRISFSDPFTITPRKRSAFKNNNATFSFSTGADVWGLDGEIEIAATASKQELRDKIKTEKGYGFEFTGQATTNDIIDYSRENDRAISKNILSLPTANYTYDVYSVNAQGISGMFRPHRSQIGQIYDEFVQDQGESYSIGGEFEGGTGWHVGGNFVKAPSESHTGVWNTTASNTFKNDNENTINKDYEPVYFKFVGNNGVDQDSELYTGDLHGDKAMALKRDGNSIEKVFKVKNYNPVTNIPFYENITFSDGFKRDKRQTRTQTIQKISKKELKDFYQDNYAHELTNDYAKDHHTAEIRILNPDGSTYVFGETAYNIEKNEVAFNTEESGDCKTGIVNYATGENTINNRSGIDHFYDKIKTPEYAHTYLISSVFSSDYQDISGNGPTDDDLGSYTTFEYVKDLPIYNWRVPYGLKTASYNAGLNTNKDDQKGSYVYGKKEIKYIKKIITKTHIAVFDISPRKDARGAMDENGTLPTGTQQVMYKLDKVRLYAKHEYKKYETELEDDDPSNDPTLDQLSPIKTANFVYDYSLCKNTDNNLGGVTNELSNDKGKLTLKQVYFTYQESNLGKYMPYKFNYEKAYDLDGDGIAETNNNPDFSLKAFDIWGNYKPNQGGCDADEDLTNQEFPFVDQTNRELQDVYAQAWTLTSINLPSGGTIDVEFESDDYQYVQNKDALQMFKVVGVGTNSTSSSPNANHKLYGSIQAQEAKYLYVELPDETNVIQAESTFKQKYLRGIEGKPMYFRFLMNMTKKGATLNSMTDFDYVTGYFELDGNPEVFETNGKIYASIPMQFTNMEGGLNGQSNVNPITKAGLYFGRNYLNGIVYGLNQNAGTENVKTIALSLLSSIQSLGQLFSGPNEALRKNQFLCAQRFIPEKSWIRLSTPQKYKVGGGLRVKKIQMEDNWSNMVAVQGLTKTYGQVYDYSLGENNGTSGVATFEPNDSAENPFVEPYYDKGERLVAPREISYVEKPFGKDFFPASAVTYSKVTVKNLEHANITKHATGKVVSEFYTSKDFPTKVDFTEMDRSYESNEANVLSQLVGSLFGLPIKVKHEFTLSQGFVIHTNDMNGKSKSQKVYQEGVDEPISTVEYKYSTKPGDESTLNNKVTVVNKNGTVINEKELGVDYDVITDFRESYSKSRTTGISANVVSWVLPPVVIPSAFPNNTTHENIAHSVITTKVLHTTALLKEKIATDLGAKITTVNEAWDATNGEVILTKTQNEFDDAYYNFNFPAYWAYKEMGAASKNIDLRGKLTPSGDYFTYPDANKYLTLGDEIIADYGAINSKRLWIVEFNTAGNGVLLMDKDGLVVNRSSLTINQNIDFKIVRSGYRNQQMANMSAITMMKNPIKDANGNYTNIDTNTFFQLANATPANSAKIINASAVSYTDFWNCQCEYGLESLPYVNTSSTELANTPIEDYNFNPYLYNVKGTWRADKSYAFLTERTDTKEGSGVKANTRKEGYFKKFTPYYMKVNDEWVKNPAADAEWVFASEVTLYSAFGPEIENRDALNRFSSAQYGYNLTLPTAVASNSRYRHMGTENFEDYDYIRSNDAHFSFKEIALEDGDGGIEASINQAHTGNTSLKIPFERAAGLPIELLGFLPPPPDSDGDNVNDIGDNCPNTYNPYQENYDGDELGDACDDNAIPKLQNWIATPRMDYDCRKQAVAIIDGTPNSSVFYEVHKVKFPRGGWSVYINGNRIGNNSNLFPLTGTLDFDSTGKAYVELQLGAQRKRKGGQFKVLVIIKDMYGQVINEYPFHTTSYKTRGCHGENYNSHHLFTPID